MRAALAAKAALAVVATNRAGGAAAGRAASVVPDVLEGLRALAAAARARTQAKVIGVTGSVGKTGTKEALRLALSKDGETHASVASYNNHWGVPLSLARCPASAALCGTGNGDEPRRARSSRCRCWRGRMSRSSRRSRRCISNSSARSPRSPTPRRKSFSGWNRAVQPFSIATIRSSPPEAARQRGECRAHCVVWRARESRRAAHQMRVACRLRDSAGGNPRHRDNL